MNELLKLGLCNKFYPGSNLHVIIGFFAVFVICYLLGSLNFGIIISKIFYHDDVRKHGSGGSGMTNMLRTYGKIPAAATFLGDGLKTVAAVFIGAVFLGRNNTVFVYETVPYIGFAGMYIGGLASIIGHAFPVYYGFRGGRGVAAVFFMVLCTEPVIGIICFAIFAAIVAGTKYISLGSIMAVLIYPLILNRMTGYGFHNLVAIFIALLIVYLHRANIQRLMNGTENKLSLKNPKNGKKEKENKVKTKAKDSREKST